MNSYSATPSEEVKREADSGLAALCGIAGYFRIPADPLILARELAIEGRNATEQDMIRGAKIIGLKARVVADLTADRLASLPTPAIVRLTDGRHAVFTGTASEGQFRVIEPLTRITQLIPREEFLFHFQSLAILITRRVGGAGIDPKTFGFRWFLPSLWRYRRPVFHVLLASFLMQIFALMTPLFFQVVVDKVLAHQSYSTLIVIVIGLAFIGIFEVVLQYLRTYILSHTTNRIDVELGQRLFSHLLRLPLSYFETRAAGQTVARMRELETVRAFLTGHGLSSLLDLVFTIVFIVIMSFYSWKLTMIVLATIPLYVAVAVFVRPVLKTRIEERFNHGAASQQFLVESIVGIQTLKAAAIEPLIRAQWEERLAAYVRSGFAATILGAGGQGAIQYIDKFSRVILLLMGAKSVIEGELTIGSLIAFNMIAAQVAQPVLRLSQLWQDFQQIQISVERLGDILNAPPEPATQAISDLPPPRGRIDFKSVTFRYGPDSPDVLKDVSLNIRPGEVIGIVGPSGSGKSSLTKLIQRLYIPQAGSILIDGVDISQIDPSWLRRHIGVVLQENLLFNRTIHENIALSEPALPRRTVIELARLAGADEFVTKMPRGYDTVIEERGANLSGGQRQRLAIARALASNPRILILDEATSALDYESERIIQENMKEIVKGRTVIIIAHRLAAVRSCNRIVGLRDGRIVEVGTHEELLDKENGLYSHLWHLQTNRF